MKLISLENIHFSYDTRKLFCGASLDVFSHSITGILGGNGAGKTTLFDLLCRLRKPSSGSIDCRSDDILYLSQVVSTPAVLTMRDIADMTISLSSTRTTGLFEIIQNLSLWDLDSSNRYRSLLEKKSSLCSYGEKRWFFTLTLLALRPDVVVLDEPTAGVDLENRYSIWCCLKQAASSGTAILVSSHDINEIVEHCHTFYIISKRRFINFRTGDQFKAYFEAESLGQAFITAVRD